MQASLGLLRQNESRGHSGFACCFAALQDDAIETTSLGQLGHGHRPPFQIDPHRQAPTGLQGLLQKSTVMDIHTTEHQVGYLPRQQAGHDLQIIPGHTDPIGGAISMARHDRQCSTAFLPGTVVEIDQG